jgi:hypothetical protein
VQFNYDEEASFHLAEVPEVRRGLTEGLVYVDEHNANDVDQRGRKRSALRLRTTREKGGGCWGGCVLCGWLFLRQTDQLTPLDQRVDIYLCAELSQLVTFYIFFGAAFNMVNLLISISTNRPIEHSI